MNLLNLHLRESSCLRRESLEFFKYTRMIISIEMKRGLSLKDSILYLF